MAKKVELIVNDNSIVLDYYVHEFVEKIAGGIIGSLNDTGEIENLELKINSGGQVTINLNGSDVSLKEFPMKIIKSTIDGMLVHLKGVEGDINTVDIRISN